MSEITNKRPKVTKLELGNNTFEELVRWGHRLDNQEQNKNKIKAKSESRTFADFVRWGYSRNDERKNEYLTETESMVWKIIPISIAAISTALASYQYGPVWLAQLKSFNNSQIVEAKPENSATLKPVVKEVSSSASEKHQPIKHKD